MAVARGTAQPVVKPAMTKPMRIAITILSRPGGNGAVPGRDLAFARSRRPVFLDRPDRPDRQARTLPARRTAQESASAGA